MTVPGEFGGGLVALDLVLQLLDLAGAGLARPDLLDY